MSSSRIRLPALTWWIIAAVVSSAGCGKKAGPVVKTELVEGVVTLDGQPVPDATVTFVPAAGSSGASATGKTDAEGKYQLTAIGAGSGAQPGAGTLPGEYDVGVRKVIVPNIPSDQEKQASLGTGAVIVGSGERPKNPELTYVVPHKYSEPQKSGLKVTVKEGKNDIPIQLDSK